MTKFKKIFFGLVLAELILFYAGPAQAQVSATTPYTGVQATVEQYLCSPAPGQTGNTLYTCINKIYRFAIAIGATAGILMIVVAGYLYMSAEGNQESIDRAKTMFTSAITAMVILFAGYLILRTLNPDIIAFKQIQPPSVKLDTSNYGDWSPLLNNEGSGGGDTKLVGATSVNGCSNCVDYTTKGLSGNGTQTAGKNTYLNADLATKLVALKAKYPGLIINEAFPPTVNHAAACHFNGTCADIGTTSGRTAAEINKFCQAVSDAGLKIYNEYSGFTASDIQACGPSHVTINTTGGHLHVN